ncbi:MAG TPA: type VII secretion-associated serine protease mycosin [Trebonia sp.]|jgi:type VII secretion-associated serine protease mycosin
MRHLILPLAAIGCTAWLAAPAVAAQAATGTPAAPATRTAATRTVAREAAAAEQTQCLSASSAESQSVPWAEQELSPQRVWSMTQGAGQVVAVVDSGVSAGAPALSGAVLPGRDTLTNGAGDSDCLGHGTFTAGIIAARPLAGSGFEGLAPQARILPVDVVSAAQEESGDTATSSSAVAAGIRYAVQAGATIIDVSTATAPGPSSALESAVGYALSRNVVIIAPVGVSSGTTSQLAASYPASYSGVIAVSAVDSSGAPVAAGQAGVRVDLAAPGSSLTSTGPQGRGTITGSGSSLATAFVAGTAALVRSYYPGLSAAQVGQRLESTADQSGGSVPDPEVGYGVVDPYTAVTTVLPAESGGRPPAAPSARAVTVPPRRAPDPWPVLTTLIVCCVAGLGIAAGTFAARVLRGARQHGWRPPPPNRAE